MQAHIDELKKQLAASEMERERLAYLLGQARTGAIEHGRQMREEEKQSFQPVVDAAKRLTNNLPDLTPGVVLDMILVGTVNLRALRYALETKYPTSGVYSYVLKHNNSGNYLETHNERGLHWCENPLKAERYANRKDADFRIVELGLVGAVSAKPL